MLSPEIIERINELANKKKSEGLTETEKREQIKLREEYLSVVRKRIKHHIERMKIIDSEGNDITPKKLKEIKKKKGI